jgi:methionyl-tRNA synthetase
MGRSRPSTGRTLPDRYIEGTCPICGYGEARGDQCDNCGNQLDPIDLINPRSKINGETPEFIETEHFFLDLPALAESRSRVARRARGDWRPQRHQVLQEPPRRHQAARDDPRHRLGHPGAARRVADNPMKRSTCGSTP